MVKLSDRLQWIADRTKPGETVADIGTDHGLLPIFLYERGIAPRVILCDINSGPLEKAKENLNRFLPGKDFDLRQGNGLGPLMAGEADAVVIAGMGGLLIADILAAEPAKSKALKRLLLQPRNHGVELRRWLWGSGYEIYDETLVREGRHLCEILCARPLTQEELAGDFRTDPPRGSDWLSFEVSPILVERSDPLLPEFLKNKIRVERKIESAIRSGADSQSEETIRRLARCRTRIDAFQRLLTKMEVEK